MGEEIYTTKYFGTKITVYNDRIETNLLGMSDSIPIKQIASIDLGLPLLGQIIIETTGGKKKKINVPPKKKKEVQDAIYKAQSAN